MRTSRSLVTVLVVLCGLLVVPGVASAASGSAACTEGGVTWRVDYTTADSPYGTVATVTGLKKTDASGESDAGSQTWELRWENLPSEWPNPGQSTLLGPHRSVSGNLGAVGAQPVATYLSPRLVTPDGACQVYIAPFANRRGNAMWPRVPVLGDSLIQSLNDNSYNQNAIQGYVEGNLNDIGIRTEVEGQGGRRWTPVKGTSGIAKADGYLLDEFRGLLEHDPDGFVVALGANDALYVALAPNETERAARLDEVRNGLIDVVREMSSRTGCLVAVTAPEHGNVYSPNYAAAALELNNVLRWIAASNSTDALELVDFAAKAKTHRKDDPAPWFGSDDLHLNMAGRLVYTATMSEAARRCADSVVLYGAAGTFDGGELAGKAWLPSGQRLRAQAVPGWDFEPGKTSYFSTQANDGTIFISNMSQTANPVFVTGNSMVISAFHPDNGTFSNIRIKTDRGKETVVDRDGRPLGFDIGETEVLPGGDAVAFTGGSPYLGQDLETQGQFPVFGVLTKGPNGWRVASGSGWQNQWSPRELYAASAPGVGGRACPLNDQGVRDCAAFVEMAVFPDSKDVVVAQYFGQPGHSAGQVTVLDLEGPDASGRYRLKVADVFELPDVTDPSAPATKVYVSGREVQTDPTGKVGNEKFALSMDVHGDIGSPLIEFAYDRDAAGSKITVMTPPMMPGDVTGTRSDGLKRFHGFGKPMYDHAGNLWGAHGDGLQGGPISVYAGARCAYDGQPLNSYVERATGVKPAWGKICKPDHALLAPTSLGVAWSVQENPQNDTIVVTTFGGVMYAIKPSGSGAGMTFKISNTVTSKAQQILARQSTWPCPTPEEPNKTCSGNPIITSTRGGPVSKDGRAWIAVEQLRPRDKTGQLEKVEQWMYSVDVSRLFGREPVRLTARTGQTTHVHAELNQTFTTAKRAGQYATSDVDSVAPMVGCQERQVWGGAACTDPVGGLTGGYVLADETGAGVPAGTAVEYRVVVPKAGSYQLAYRATDRASAGRDEQIEVAVDGTARGTTTIPSNDALQTVTGPVLALSEGTHTVRLSAPEGHHGWQLDWTAFTRRPN